MLHIRTQIEIAAPRADVWAILMDFASYPSWNPFVKSISGSPTPGTTLDVRIQPAGGTAMSFRPRVLTCEALREFRWRGRVLLSGVFDGEHYFQLSEPGPRRTAFTHGESFSGFLVPLVMRGAMARGTEQGFQAMNTALRLRAEGMRGA